MVPGVTTRVTSRRDQALGLPSLLDLVADGDAVAGAQQLVQVVFELMVREARHRHGLVAAGQRQAQDLAPTSASSSNSS